MTALISKKTGKTIESPLEDLGGYCMFSYKAHEFSQYYPFFRSMNFDLWLTLARRLVGLEKKPIYVRFVNPKCERFGSIAKLEKSAYTTGYIHYLWSGASASKETAALALARDQRIIGRLYWDGRRNRPSFLNNRYQVEFLPDYNGKTVWSYDTERLSLIRPTTPVDKLGRAINVGDLCTYILYHFDYGSAASICFGNVTKIDPDGKVWCRNVALGKNSKSVEKAVKDSSLITILTDDLLDQIMLAKLRSS